MEAVDVENGSCCISTFILCGFKIQRLLISFALFVFPHFTAPIITTSNTYRDVINVIAFTVELSH